MGTVSSSRFAPSTPARYVTLALMPKETASLARRVGVVVLLVGVLACMALPMTDDDMAGSQISLFCSFAVTVLLGLFVLGRTRIAAASRISPSHVFASITEPRHVARGPDLLALGTLLI